MRKIKQWACGFTGHDWTSESMQGKPPTEKQINDGVQGFFDYATMYCRRCGYVSKLGRNRGV